MVVTVELERKIAMGEAKFVRDDAIQLIQMYQKEFLSTAILLPLTPEIFKSTMKGRKQDAKVGHHRLAQDARQQQHATTRKVADLPVQVFERLLLLLPIQSLFQARAVCKAWKSIISSSSFLPLWLETFQDRCFLMGYPDGRQVMALSDVALERKWRCYTPPPAPFMSFKDESIAIHPAASDGGLVLYLCQDSYEQTTTFCVINPFTGSNRMLPPVDLMSQGVGRTEVLISADESGSGYFVFVVGLTRTHNKNKFGIVISAYNSRTSRWVKRGITPDDDSIAPGNWSAVHSNGVLYILSHVDGVISYDHELDIWGRVGTPFREIYVNGWLVHEKLLIHEGRLLLVGTTLERDEYTDELRDRLYIHELRTQPGYGDCPYVYWDVFDRMPDAIMQDINPNSRPNIMREDLLEDVDPQSFAERNILPVNCYQCDDVVLLFFHGMNSYSYTQGPDLVAYRLSTKTWTRIVRWNDFAMGIEKKRAVSGFPYEECAVPRVTFNVVGFKPSLATI